MMLLKMKTKKKKNVASDCLFITILVSNTQCHALCSLQNINHPRAREHSNLKIVAKFSLPPRSE